MGIERRRMLPIYDALPFRPSDAAPVDWLLQTPSGWDISLPSYVMSNLATITRDTVVVDPFVGAGATMLAADEMVATCLGSDIDPLAVVSSFAKTYAPTDAEVAAAVELLMELIAEDLMRMPRALQVAHPLWVSCAASAMIANWTLKSLIANSGVRYCTVERFRLEQFATNGSPTVLLADARSSALWQLISDMNPEKDLLILTSPPFPDSRGNASVYPNWLRASARVLADRISHQMVGPETAKHLIAGMERNNHVAWHSVLLARVAKHCSGHITVVAEYETVNSDWSWLESVAAEESIDSWSSVELLPFYWQPPDGREGVTEGGLLIAHRAKMGSARSTSEPIAARGARVTRLSLLRC